MNMLKVLLGLFLFSAHVAWAGTEDLIAVELKVKVSDLDTVDGPNVLTAQLISLIDKATTSFYIPPTPEAQNGAIPDVLFLVGPNTSIRRILVHPRVLSTRHETLSPSVSAILDKLQAPILWHILHAPEQPISVLMQLAEYRTVFSRTLHENPGISRTELRRRMQDHFAATSQAFTRAQEEGRISDLNFIFMSGGFAGTMRARDIVELATLPNISSVYYNSLQL